MKTIALWLSGLTALFLFSCTKDVNETTALSDYSASSRFNPSNTQPSAGVTAEFSKDPATPGETVQLVINTTASCGKLMVERAVNGNGDFTSAENAVDWIDYSMNIDATGSAINVPYTTTDIGIWGFRVHYISSGQGCNYANEFIELNLTVEAACAGLSLSRELVSAIDKGGNNYEFTVVYTVEACDDTYTEAKLQGGLTAFVGDPTTSSSNESHIEERQTNHNFVITYTKNQVTGNNTYTVVFMKNVTGAPGTNELTGNWSFSAKDTNGNPVRVECDRIYF